METHEAFYLSHVEVQRSSHLMKAISRCLISPVCFWQCHFRGPVWRVLWLHYWHLDLRTVLTLPHSTMIDCRAEWL